MMLKQETRSVIDFENLANHLLLEKKMLAIIVERMRDTQ